MKFSRIAVLLLAAATFLNAAEPSAKSAARKVAPKSRVPEGVEVIADVVIGKGGDRDLHVDI
ncbi:MAG: hypothetical protein FJ388_24660, partial [Verrucomicrobia bacterium]|nr:hypothetical protein [Verrucomicrobiota bacterium]